MVIDLIRHGEPVGGRRYRGHIDDPLSELGWRQMWQAVGSDCPWAHIYSSPLRRCSEFAAALAARHGVDVTLDERLMEVGFGTWEGHTAEELLRVDATVLDRFYADPVAQRPSGAEPLEGFRDRVTQAWEDILRRRDAEAMLVVAHAGTIRAVISHLLAIPLQYIYRLNISNAGMTRIRLRPGRPVSIDHVNGRH
jgi:alpha-ribazole phosphatase